MTCCWKQKAQAGHLNADCDRPVVAAVRDAVVALAALEAHAGAQQRRPLRRCHLRAALQVQLCRLAPLHVGTSVCSCHRGQDAADTRQVYQLPETAIRSRVNNLIGTIAYPA